MLPKNVNQPLLSLCRNSVHIFKSYMFFPMFRFKRDPTKDASCPENIQLFSSAGKEVLFLFQFQIPHGAAMLVQCLPMKSKKS